MTVTPFAEEHDALRDSVSRLVGDLAGLAQDAEVRASPPPAALDRCREVGLFELDDILADVAAAEALGRIRSAGLVRVILDQMLAADVGMDVGEPVAVARLNRDGTRLPLVTAATVARPCLALSLGVTVDLTAAEALVHETAWRLRRDADAGAAVAARHATATVEQVTDMCLQLHGGYGYTPAFDIERAWRDAHVRLEDA